MRRISSDIEEKVIEMWFEGYIREYIAKTLGLGEATVSDINGTLPSCLQIPRDIAVTNRKHNTTLADAWKRARLLKRTVELCNRLSVPSIVQDKQRFCADRWVPAQHYRSQPASECQKNHQVQFARSNERNRQKTRAR